MRRRISWLVAATTSAVVLAFVIPLCLLVRTVAEDRALAAGNEEARSVAILVSGLGNDPTLGQLVAQADRRSAARTSVIRPDGTVLGSPAPAVDPDEREALTTANGGSAFTHVDAQGAEIVVPVVTGQGTSVVLTTVSRELMRAGVYRAWASIVLLGLLLMVAALFIADRLGRRVSEPVTALAAVAQQLESGDLDARAEPHGPEETVELARTVNRLADRILELLAAERAAVGDLSHRLRTPVTALRLDAEGVPDAELADRLQTHIEHLQRTIDALVRDARRPLRSSLTAACDATTVVGDRIAFWAALAEDQGRELTVELPDGSAEVGLQAADLVDVLDVLVDNVFAHTPDGVPFRVAVLPGADHVVLEVADSGPGRSRADQPVDGDPHHERIGSTGLGLQIVRRTAARVGGHLTVREGTPGLVTRVSLPRPGPRHGTVGPEAPG